MTIRMRPPRAHAVRPYEGSDVGLVRGMTFVHALALVVGGMVGTGIYLRSALMAEQLGSAPLVLLAWLAAGLLSLAGALTYAELSARLPHTGGEYVFMREVYGVLPAFLYGWTRTLVGGASLAAVAVAFATFLSGLVPMGEAWWSADLRIAGRPLSWSFGVRQVVAIAALGLLTAINCAGIVAGARTQTVLTVAKVLGLAGLIVGALVFAPQIDLARLTAMPDAGMPDRGAFGAAMIAALWAYAGWSNLPMAAGEVRNPERTMPRAIISGALLVTALYLLVNTVYFVVLPFDAVSGANSTTHPHAPALGALAAQAFLGSAGSAVVLGAFCISALGTANGMVLSTARVPFAMARDGLLPASLARLGERSRAPVWAILVMGAWTALLASLGTIDQLATSAVVGYWIFHTLCGLALFHLRRRERRSGAPRHDGFRVPGYPVVPAVFVGLGGYLVLNSLRATPIEAAWATGVLALGLPACLVLRRWTAGRASNAGNVTQSEPL